MLFLQITEEDHQWTEDRQRWIQEMFAMPGRTDDTKCSNTNDATYMWPDGDRGRSLSRCDDGMRTLKSTTLCIYYIDYILYFQLIDEMVHG